MRRERHARTAMRAAVVTGLAWLPCVSSLRAQNDPEARFRGAGRADPMRITNVRRADGPLAGQSTIALDLAWDHSWRAAWEVGAEQTGAGTALKIE